MAVPHRVELPGSPKIVMGESGIRATREFQTEWSDWYAFAQYLGGGFTQVGDSFLPIKPTQFPGNKYLLVSGIAVEPMFSDTTDSIGEIAKPEWSLGSHTKSGAKVTVEYTVRKSESGGGDVTPPEGTTISYSESFGFERVSTDGRHWVWNADPQVRASHDFKHALVVPIRDIAITWSNVADIPYDAIDDATGRINKTKFFGRAKYTTLFVGANIRRVYNWVWEGPPTWSLEYHFKWRQPPGGENGWNDHWRPEHGWEELLMWDGATGSVAYVEHDLMKLFPGATT